MGISTVYKEINLCPNLTVAENLLIEEKLRKAGMIDWKTMNKKSAELLVDLNIDVSGNPEPGRVFYCKSADDCGIARAVDMKCKVLILMSLPHLWMKRKKSCSCS